MFFGKQYETIIESLAERWPPDYEPLKNALDKGLDINIYDDEENDSDLQDTLLSYVLDGYGYNSDVIKDGRFLPQIIRFFLDNGYNMKLNNGFHGVNCLKAMCYSWLCDKYCVEAVKLLLDAGADPSISIYDDEECDALTLAEEHDWDNRGLLENDDFAANYYYTLTEIFRNHIEGNDRDDIYHPDDIIGRKLEGVFVKNAFETTENHEGVKRSLSFDNLTLIFEDITVKIDTAIGIIGEKRTGDVDQNETVDVSKMFSGYIGKTINEIDYSYKEIRNFSPHCLTNCRFAFEDGSGITISQDRIDARPPFKIFAYVREEN